MSKNIQIKLLTEDSIIPKKQHELDIGYDLHSSVDIKLASKKVTRVKTAISISLPKDIGGFVLPRSGLSSNHLITLINSPGLIDPGYTGELIIPLINHGEENYKIKRGDRIAQLVFINVQNIEFEVVNNHIDTERSDKGFGSTG